MRVAVTVSVLCLSGAACLLPEVAGLTGAGATIDAGATDAGATDATDAGADAMGAGDARFCTLAPQPNLICDDFDDDTPLSGWTTTTKSFSELVRAPDTFVSPPFSLRTRHPSRDAGADGFVSLELVIPTPARGLRAAFSARINVDIPKAAPLQEVFQFWPTSMNGGGWVSANFVEFQPEKAPTSTKKDFVVLPTLGKWQAWVVTLTRPPDAGAGSIEVRLDGVVAASLPLASTDLGPSIRLVIGPEHLRVEDDWSVEYDNVLITAL